MKGRRATDFADSQITHVLSSLPVHSAVLDWAVPAKQFGQLARDADPLGPPDLPVLELRIFEAAKPTLAKLRLLLACRAS
jgi:hypothetical protein